VLQRVSAPVDAGALPVPEAHDPVVAGVRVAVQHLGARERRGGQLLVRARHVADVVLGQDPARLAEGEVVAPEGRAGIAADERPDPEVRPAVAPALVDRQAHEGLHAGEVDRPLLPKIAVVEAQLGTVHGAWVDFTVSMAPFRAAVLASTRHPRSEERG
jgi:hypothetical protein